MGMILCSRFFFVKQKTAYEMRISDWSSDVCSSDLPPFAGKEAATQALRFERRLELGMEGHRFFDLVRWGVAKSVMDAYFEYEGTITSDVTGAKFRSEEHTSELQSLMRISYAVFCLKKKKNNKHKLEQ